MARDVGVLSVTGDGVDNTDPQRPVIRVGGLAARAAPVAPASVIPAHSAPPATATTTVPGVVLQAVTVPQLVDNSGGAISKALAPPSSAAAIANNLASLNSQINQIIDALRIAGIMR